MKKKEITKLLEEKGFSEDRINHLTQDLYDFNVYLTKKFPGKTVFNAGRKETENYLDFLVKKGKNNKSRYMNLKDFAYNIQNGESYNVFIELLNNGNYLRKK